MNDWPWKLSLSCTVDERFLVFFFKQIEYHLTGGMRNCGGDGPNRWIFNISRAIAEIEFKFRVETRFISAFFGVFLFLFLFLFFFGPRRLLV